MPRGRPLYRSSLTTLRPAPGAPLWWLGWAVQHAMTPELAEAVWTALAASRHPVARQIVTHWRRFHQHPTADARAQALWRHLCAVRVYEWATVLEALVDAGQLPRPAANACLDAFLVVTDTAGEWR